MPTILGNANAILAVPNIAGTGGTPPTDFIIQENNVGPGTFRMLTESGLDLMVRE
tara:strand:+ start:2869 stop:3033 length:165 start_codon:yes stop_codon:yes gene_type:complete